MSQRSLDSRGILIPEVWSGQDRALTVEDMENMPDDEFSYELDDGVLIVSPASSVSVPLTIVPTALVSVASCPNQ